MTDIEKDAFGQAVTGMEQDRFRRAVTGLWQAAGRVGVLAVTGTSMEPVLRAGDEVVVRYGTTVPVALGDLVVFERDGRSVVHRVIAIRGRAGQRRLLERGDRSPAGTWIDAAEVVGVVLGRPGPAGVVPLESPAVRRRRARRSRLTLALARVRRGVRL